MTILSLVATALGWSLARVIATLAAIAVGAAAITGMVVKIYMAGVHAEQLRQERASAAAIARSLENDAKQAKADAAKAEADAERMETLLNELQDGDDTCLDPATVERLRGVIGR